MKQKIKRMLKQRSTWRGLIMIAAAVGLKISPHEAELILSLVFSLLGVSDVVQDE